MPRAHALLATALLCCTTTRIANAGTEAAAVVVAGKAPDKERATVGAAVRSAARSAGWELVETPLTDSEAAAILACLNVQQRWACMAPVVSPKGIQRLIVVNVEPARTATDSGALTVTERVLLPGSEITESDSRPCLKCTAESLSRITFDLTRGLLNEASAGSGRTKLRVSSIPQGAWITLDSANAGLTDRTYSTFPGRHIVILQRDGYQTETRTIEVAENRETIVAVTLRPQQIAAPRTEGSPAHPYLIPAIVGGAGLAALATGIVLQLAKDPPAVGNDQPARLVSVPGVALITAGSLAIGTSVYLWLRATRKPSHASTPAVSLVPGGGIAGLAGHF